MFAAIRHVSITAVLAVVGSTCFALDAERFPQHPAEFLADSKNTLLTVALEQNASRLRFQEEQLNKALEAGPRHDYAVALLAMGRTTDAHKQLELSRSAMGNDVELLETNRLIEFYVFLRENSVVAASQILNGVCSFPRSVSVGLCAHLFAHIASISGKREDAIAAMRKLRRAGTKLTFPLVLVPKEPRWDAVRVAHYVSMKAFNGELWDTYWQEWTRYRTRSNVVGQFDVTHAKSFSEAWRNLESLAQYEFSWGNYKHVLEWIYEFELEAIANDWQFPIERSCFAARAHLAMGDTQEASSELKDSGAWIRKTYKDPVQQYDVLLSFLRVCDVPGMEGLTKPYLKDVFDRASQTKNIYAKLLGLEAALKLMENYGRTGDLEELEKLRLSLAPLANQLERTIPADWNAKRFYSAWIELKTAEAILTYDARRERLSEVAQKLLRKVSDARRLIASIAKDPLDQAREIDRASEAQGNQQKRIIRAAAEFLKQAVPVLGRIYVALNSWDQAAPLAETSHFLAMANVACGKPAEQSNNTIALAKIARMRGREPEFKTWLNETRACAGVWDNRSIQYAWLLSEDARELAANANFYSAEYALSQAIWIHRELGRPQDRELAAYRHQYAELLSEQGDVAFALDEMAASSEILAAIDRRDWSADELRMVERQIRLYGEIAKSVSDKHHRARALQLAFMLSQRWLSNEAGWAIEALARRRLFGDERLAALVQRRDDLSHQRDIQDREFGRIIGTSSSAEVLRNLQGISTQIAALDQDINKIDTELSTRTSSLLGSSILTIDDVQQVLKHTELLVYFVVGHESVFRWTITTRTATVEPLPTTAIALADQINRFRCRLDESAWSWKAEGVYTCSDLTQLSPSGFDIYQVPFDLRTAYELYKSLFGSLESASESWIIIPSGALSSLSFAALATEPADNKAPSTSNSWLGTKIELSILPAVSSLRSLRGETSRANKTYTAFGNPLLAGPPKLAQLRSFSERWRRCSDHNENVCQTILPKSSTFSGGVPRIAYSELEPVPQTVCELCTIADSLGLSKGEADDAIRLGSYMTKTNIKRLGAADAVTGRSELQNFKIIHFATHAVMAGQLIGTDDPGLIVTLAPANTRKLDPANGLLTIGDIAQLKLDADWVILSACNTAASRRPGEEAFSGIARAFLYAGARSVLVSHWSVSTNAAVKITTTALRVLASGRATTRSSALRSALREIIREASDDNASGSAAVRLHPAYWGAFALIGDVR